MMENKTCVRCDKNKPLSSYRKNKNNKDGYKGTCKECLKKDDLKYRELNHSEIKNKSKFWIENNKESINKSKKKWRDNNPEIIKKWRNDNPEKVKELAKISAKNFRKNNPFKVNIRNSIRQNLVKNGFSKKSKTCNILNCSFEELKLYFESKFEYWMNWDNYGNPKDGVFEINKTWDIDHIIPLSSAITEDDIIKLNHYTNLQPLCSYTNRFIKRDTI